MTENTETPDDPREAALIRAGCRQESLGDAAQLFRPGGNLATGIWHMDDRTGTADELAQAWIDKHPWFRGAEPEAPDQTDKYRPTYADGSRIPASNLSADELFEMVAKADAAKAAAERRPQAKPETPEAIAAAREALRRDAAEAHRAEQAKKLAIGSDGHPAANLPPGVSAEFRSHYSDEKTADELFAAAGPHPHPWKP